MWRRCRSFRGRLSIVVSLIALAVTACGGAVGSQGDAGDGGVLSDAATCRRYTIVGDLSGFSPAYAKPVATAACSKQSIVLAVSSCVDSSASASACNAYAHQDKGCFGCLFGGAGSPFSLGDAGVFRNRGACVELVSTESGPATCGGRIQALDQCSYAACSSEKTVDECADVTTTGLADPKCPDRAAMTVCKTYSGLVNGCGGSFPQCFSDDVGLASAFCL